MLQRIESTEIMATLRKLSRSLWTNFVTLYILLLMLGEAESGENHSTYVRCVGNVMEDWNI